MEHNRVVELGSLIKPAKTIRCGDDYYPVLSMTMHDGLVFQEEKFKKEVASKNKADYKVVFKNQLVVGFPIDEGVLATQRIVDAGIVSPAYGIWDVDQSKIHPEFLEWALRRARALDYYRAKLRGSTARRRSLPTETFLKFTLPLPSISEQMHILDIIHKLQVMLRSRQQQLAKLDELVKARFVEMFGDPHINSKGFPTKKGLELFKISNGKAIASSRRFDNGIPAYGGNGISYHTDDVLCEKDTIVIGRVGFQSGNVHLAKGPVWVTDNAMYISEIYDNDLNLTFLCEMMEHIDFTKYQDAGDLKKVTQQPFMEMGYIIPSRKLQNEYISFVEQTNKLKLSIQNGLNQTETLKKTLMQQYFG